MRASHALALALAMVPFGVALAETPPEVHVDYRAVKGCPGAAAFEEQLRSRNPRIRTTEDPHVRTLIVRVEGAGRQLTGRLTLHETTGAETSRTVAGDSCAELVKGLALIGALAIDPTAVSAAAATTTTATTTPASTTTPTTTPAATPGTAPTSTSGSTTAPGATAAPSSPASGVSGSPAVDTASVGRSDARSRWSLAFGVGPELAFGATPLVLLTAPVFVELTRDVSGVFAPAARLRFEHSSAGARTATGAGADFAWTVGDLDVCPAAWTPWRLRLQPCVRVEVGVLEASGVGVLPSRSAARPYAGLGPIGRARLMVVHPVFVELDGGVLFALTQDHYFLQPSTTVFAMSAVGGRIGFGAGASF